MDSSNAFQAPFIGNVVRQSIGRDFLTLGAAVEVYLCIIRHRLRKVQNSQGSSQYNIIPGTDDEALVAMSNLSLDVATRLTSGNEGDSALEESRQQWQVPVLEVLECLLENIPKGESAIYTATFGLLYAPNLSSDALEKLAYLIRHGFDRFDANIDS